MRVGLEVFSHGLTRINGFDKSERLAADRTKGECLEPCDPGARRYVRRKAEQGWWRNPIA